MRRTTRTQYVSGFVADLMAAIGLLLLTLGNPASAAPGSTSNFDHIRTGFPLTGAHAQVDCQSCHLGGVFQGTPRQCALCHFQGSRRATTFKPANHVQTTQPCELCHTSTVTWSGARFMHTNVVPGGCMQCHNGGMATGKPPGHVQTTASCDTCHRTTAWIPATFNHANVVPGSCAQCHNGTTATGKPAGHVQTTDPCDRCHNTSTWAGATFSHAGVTPGTCNTCHTSGSGGATVKPNSHIPTSNSCDACHNTTTFTTSTFNHTAAQGVIPGQCETCHNGAYTSQGAQGKPNDHPNTTLSCDSAGCHNTTTFHK
jgi:hypothetical protein